MNIRDALSRGLQPKHVIRSGAPMLLLAFAFFAFKKFQRGLGYSSHGEYVVFTALSYAAGTALLSGGLMFAARRFLSRSFMLVLGLDAFACWWFWTLGEVLPVAASANAFAGIGISIDPLANACSWVAALISLGSFIAFALELDGAQKRLKRLGEQMGGPTNPSKSLGGG